MKQGEDDSTNSPENDDDNQPGNKAARNAALRNQPGKKFQGRGVEKRKG